MLINKHDESIESVCSLRFLATDRLSLKRASLCDIALNGTSTQKIAIIILDHHLTCDEFVGLSYFVEVFAS